MVASFERLRYKLQIWVRVMVMVFNANFNNSSVKSGRSVLFVEEIGVPRETHRPAARSL